MKRKRHPQARGRSGRVKVNFARIRQDLKAHGLTSASLPAVLEAHFGIETTPATVARWFTRGTLTMQQFAELAVLSKLETGSTLNFWHYVERDHKP
jgi:hypothetical protein